MEAFPHDGSDVNIDHDFLDKLIDDLDAEEGENAGRDSLTVFDTGNLDLHGPDVLSPEFPPAGSPRSRTPTFKAEPATAPGSPADPDLFGGVLDFSSPKSLAPPGMAQKVSQVSSLADATDGPKRRTAVAPPSKKRNAGGDTNTGAGTAAKRKSGKPAAKRAKRTKKTKADKAKADKTKADKTKADKQLPGSSLLPNGQRCYKKRRTEGLEGFMANGPTIDEAIAAGLIPPLPEGDTKEIRKQRRLIRNRVSAQLHRERKKLYLENLEKRVCDQADEIERLEAQVHALKAQLAAHGLPTSTCSDSDRGSVSVSSSADATACESDGAGSSCDERSSTPMTYSGAGTTAAHGADSLKPLPIRIVAPVHTSDQETDVASAGEGTASGMTSASDSERIDSGGSSPPQSPSFQQIDLDGIFADSIGEDASALMAGPLLQTPKGADGGSQSNPKKRAFFMLGMFFFVTLFGGALINQQSATTSSLAATQQRQQLSRAAESAAPVSRRRHLLSAEEDLDPNDNTASMQKPKASWLEGFSNATSEALRESERDGIDGGTGKAVALWKDLNQLHQFTAAASSSSLLSSSQASSSSMSSSSSSSSPDKNLHELISSVFNATTLASGKMFAPPPRNVARPIVTAPPAHVRKIRGGSQAVVPTSAVVPYSGKHGSASSISGALGSVWTLQKHLQRQHQHRTAWVRDSSHSRAGNGSTILCPKPYGMLGANATSPADQFREGAGGVPPLYSQIDTNLVLLLPSSSVPRPQMDTDNASVSWDGTWVEVDATITAIRQLPHYGAQGELAAGQTSASTAVGAL